MAGGGSGDSSSFDAVLRHLRGLAAPCEPPVGVGSFLLLYASEREVVVWYCPVREEHIEREVVIPCAPLLAAWAALETGERLDEPTLVEIGGSHAMGRWLLALLAQLPGVHVLEGEAVTLLRQPGIPEASAQTATAPKAARRKPAH
ncbi:MAG: hypothetical protein OJF49_004522 [Ktedonobacterales bacterium]|jgi:hypothetical protein|nr:MAG: hypothetical protein OJF49_004522 [Ktedonobacterales bacterium]